MIKALFFGGAFNPLTKAHLELAEYVKDQLGLEKVIFVPSKTSYIKDDQKKDMAFSNEARYQMLMDVKQSRDWMEVSRYELDADHQPRSYETLCYLKTQGYACHLLFGSDKLLELEHGWKHVDELMHEFGIVVMERNHDDIESIIHNDPYLNSYGDCIKVIKTSDRYQSISSTKVRLMLKECKKYQKELSEVLPREVMLYFLR